MPATYRWTSFRFRDLEVPRYHHSNKRVATIAVGRKSLVLVRAFVLRMVGSHMSASIPQVELNPRSTHSRLPEWFVYEIEARNQAPRRRVAVWRSRTRPVGNCRTTIHPRRRHRQFDDPEYRRVRIAALASVVAAVAWTSFCITTAFVRLDSANFGKWRGWLISADEPVMPLGERFEAATAALREVSPGVPTPVVVVADSIGAADSALPLLMKVTSYVPDTKIVLKGLAVGTTLTVGASVGDREWWINIKDLPGAYVIPPQGFVGPMTLVAELRDIDGHPLLRAPGQLTWTAVAAPSAMAGKESAEGERPVTAVASAADSGNQQLSGQFVEQNAKVVLPKPRPIKHASLGGRASKPKKQIATAHGYKERMPRRDLGADTRWASNELPPRSSFSEPDPRRERRAIVDGIFRSLFYGGDANECGPATLKRGTQKKSGEDCQWSR